MSLNDGPTDSRTLRSSEGRSMVSIVNDGITGPLASALSQSSVVTASG